MIPGAICLATCTELPVPEASDDDDVFKSEEIEFVFEIFVPPLLDVLELNVFETAAAANCAAICGETFMFPLAVEELSLFGGPGALVPPLFDDAWAIVAELTVVVAVNMLAADADVPEAFKLSTVGVKTPGGTDALEIVLELEFAIRSGTPPPEDIILVLLLELWLLLWLLLLLPTCFLLPFEFELIPACKLVPLLLDDAFGPQLDVFEELPPVFSSRFALHPLFAAIVITLRRPASGHQVCVSRGRQSILLWRDCLRQKPLVN
uniref:Uncharacterized protein n=1 Tax=Glossina pallidipes TaxID=7398 RepID=A0A1A9Z5B0_GLOPL